MGGAAVLNKMRQEVRGQGHGQIKYVQKVVGVHIGHSPSCCKCLADDDDDDEIAYFTVR